MISSEASHLQIGIVERRDDIWFYTHYPTNKGHAGLQLLSGLSTRGLSGPDSALSRKPLGAPKRLGIEYPTVPEVVDEHFGGCRILTSQRVGWSGRASSTPAYGSAQAGAAS